MEYTVKRCEEVESRSLNFIRFKFMVPILDGNSEIGARVYIKQVLSLQQTQILDY